jgi:hypothetical protein
MEGSNILSHTLAGIEETACHPFVLNVIVRLHVHGVTSQLSATPHLHG